MRVYVAGPYSRKADGTTANIIEALMNMRVGMKASVEVLLNGHVPFCPFLDYQFWLVLPDDAEIPMEAIKAYSMEWLRVSEAIVMLPGWENSGGCKAELAEAQRLGLRVYWTMEELRADLGFKGDHWCCG